jgi:hypothetical protein
LESFRGEAPEALLQAGPQRGATDNWTSGSRRKAALAERICRKTKHREPPEGAANWLIVGGGIVFSITVLTITVLTGLLIYGLTLMASLRATTGAG